MSLELSTSPATSPAVATPLFGRTALAILGSMLLLIAALTVVLVQTTWAAPDASVETSAPTYPDTPDLAQR